MRRTKIIATVGPATDAPGVLEAVLAAGVDVVRLNAAHGTADELAARYAAVRETARRIGREIGVLVDLPGAKLRLGPIAEGTTLAAGEPFTLLAEAPPDDAVGDARGAFLTYPGLAADVTVGDRVLFDDGRIELVVTGVTGRDVITRVVSGGPISSGKGVNVPGVTLGAEAITPRDRAVLEWALHVGVDFIGQSFVRCAADVDAMRALMPPGRAIPIIAKIEKHEAVPVIAGIVSAADAVMVARGDLGVETSPEEVPVIQRRIIAAARAAGKPVIVATQMLESMTSAARPTRAEASDVANAIFQRVDACMLSAETAVGRYPAEAVQTMARIAATAEADIVVTPQESPAERSASVQQAVSAAVCSLAADLRLAAIVTVTRSGATALAVSQHRPASPIIAVTPSAQVACRLSLVWGVRTLVVPFAKDTDALFDSAAEMLLGAGLAELGSWIAITAGRGPVESGSTDLIFVRQV
ncbi:MAG: pyruvate kinase [Coriobacteriia bacterium]|nr:pyruvate kinase [Coriobacteriia bacterium]